MIKTMKIIGIIFILSFATAVAVYAGPLAYIGKLIGGNVLAWLLSAVVGIAVTANSVITLKIILTLKEGSEFVGVIADAMADHKITKDELKNIKKEGLDVFNIWRRTPNPTITS